MKKKANYTEKPYNRCLACSHRMNKRCDGARSSAMELKRWCEYMRDMKEINGLTNAYIAEKADVSIKTVERIMALNDEQDIMRDTARRIENAIIGSANRYPCYLAFEESAPDDKQKLNDAMRELERAMADNKDFRSALDNIHASYNAEMQTIREEAQKKIDFLLAEIQRLRTECAAWRSESDRKSKIIDNYITKLIK